jgi:tryptophanyl-tRNA synthetase
MGIKTDSTPVDQPKNPDTCTVFALYKLFATAEKQARLANAYRNPMAEPDLTNGKPFGFGHAKAFLQAEITREFAAARKKRKELERNPGVVEEALTQGARRAREVAQITMRLVRERVGMHARPV